ncbi:glycosyltransferase family 4 protein [Candidatus Microgenomates bacterium]|nr:glycosyltransferase family 4 protein [Candidatus Microgenomates bacterium]
MKILMLVPFLPNTQTSGGQTRWYNIVKFLSEEHEITLISLIKDESEKRFIPELEKYCKKVMVFNRPKSPWTFRNIFLSIFSPFPLLLIRNFSFKERIAVKKELENGDYDLIHAEAFYVMPHIPKTEIPSIQVEQTIWHRVYEHHVKHEVSFLLRPFFMIDVLKLKFWEIYFWKKATKLFTVSPDDKIIMEQLIPGEEIEVIPNGVDVSYYTEKTIDKHSPPRIMYGVTNFEWMQNREAADLLTKEVWPIIKRKVKNVNLWIVGRMIPEAIKKLSRENSDILITENIPDARDAYLGAYVMVAPIKGSGGTRLKVLEAMAAGLPIVSTSTGVAGLGIEDGVHALISDTMEGLADETVRLIQDKKLADKIGKAGQKFVRDNYDWKAIVDMHDQIYKKAIEKGKKTNDRQQ